MSTDPETVTISKEEYDQFVRDSNFLRRLYAAGVDSWEGYEVAQDDDDDDDE